MEADCSIIISDFTVVEEISIADCEMKSKKIRKVISQNRLIN